MGRRAPCQKDRDPTPLESPEGKAVDLVSFLLTDLAGGDFDLTVAWFAETSRSIDTFPTRAAAMAEAERQLRMWVANGWEPCGDRR